MRTIVLIALLTGCAGVKQATVPAGYALHLGEDWYPLRAQSLGISVDDAKARDDALSEEEPSEVWDETAAVEAAAVWRDVCAKCHGPSGDPDEAPTKLDVPPRSWSGVGPAMGF